MVLVGNCTLLLKAHRIQPPTPLTPAPYSGHSKSKETERRATRASVAPIRSGYVLGKAALSGPSNACVSEREPPASLQHPVSERTVWRAAQLQAAGCRVGLDNPSTKLCCSDFPPRKPVGESLRRCLEFFLVPRHLRMILCTLGTWVSACSSRHRNSSHELFNSPTLHLSNFPATYLGGCNIQ